MCSDEEFEVEADSGARTDGGVDADEFDVDGPQYCTHTEYATAGGEPAEGVPATGEGSVGLERRVWDALYSVEDPEMPISIVDLGLIYGVEVEEASGNARVDMTLTYTGCPARDMLRDDIREAVADVDGVSTVDLELVWNPPWTVDMVTEQGKEDLREFGLSV